MTVEVNGELYEYTPPEEPKAPRLPALLMAMASMYEGAMVRERKRPDVNIVDEFARIQRKQSNLSRNDREWVKFQFNRHYTKINEPG